MLTYTYVKNVEMKIPSLSFPYSVYILQYVHEIQIENILKFITVSF